MFVVSSFVYSSMLEINWPRPKHVSPMQTSCIYRYRGYTITGIIAVVTAAIAAHAIIVHVAGELFPFGFVFVVLLIVHAHATAAGIDVCDALATTAITVNPNKRAGKDTWNKGFTHQFLFEMRWGHLPAAIAVTLLFWLWILQTIIWWRRFFLARWMWRRVTVP